MFASVQTIVECIVATKADPTARVSNLTNDRCFVIMAWRPSPSPLVEDSRGRYWWFSFLAVEPAQQDALRHSLGSLMEYRFRFVVGGSRITLDSSDSGPWFG